MRLLPILALPIAILLGVPISIVLLCAGLALATGLTLILVGAGVFFVRRMQGEIGAAAARVLRRLRLRVVVRAAQALASH